MTAHASILLIEDSPGECELFRMALTQVAADLILHTESDIEQAWCFLLRSSEADTLPSLIVLDLKLRNGSGLGLLKRLRADVRLAHVPVIIFTTSDAAVDLAACYAAGANGYVVKPGLFEQLVEFVRDLSRYWIHWNRSPYMVETKC
jgi:DNA-binding response OmpR family regulator